MPTTTSYGYTKPTDGDRGFWNSLNTNVQQLNDHAHNGVNSAKIAPTAITKATQSILAAAWSSSGGGNYTQTVTLPAGYLFSTGLSVKFYNYAGGAIKDEVAMTPVWVTDSTYQLEINDNTITLAAVYA